MRFITKVLLCVYRRFSKIRSHIILYMYVCMYVSAAYVYYVYVAMYVCTVYTPPIWKNSYAEYRSLGYRYYIYIMLM